MELEGQMSFFDMGKTPLQITKPIRLIELFAGIGAQAKALERLNVPFEHWKVIEIDKYAVRSYNAIHGTNFEPTDICNVHAEDLEITDTDKYTYILTYSFPCTDLSLAGRMGGMGRESGTRSGLLWEVERILRECKNLPQILLMENVTQVHGKRNLEDWKEWVRALEGLAYTSTYADLNARNYGIPQNRNRTFMVSWLGEHTYKFPEEIPLKTCLKDCLDEDTDDKYYLTDEAVDKLLHNLDARGWKRLEESVNDEEAWNSAIAEYLKNSTADSEA